MNFWYWIGVGITLLIGYALAIITSAWGLKAARDSGKIVFIEQDAVKDYLFIIGVKKEELRAVTIYKDSRVTMATLRKRPLDFMKDLDLEEHM